MATSVASVTAQDMSYLDVVPSTLRASGVDADRSPSPVAITPPLARRGRQAATGDRRCLPGSLARREPDGDPGVLHERRLPAPFGTTKPTSSASRTDSSTP